MNPGFLLLGSHLGEPDRRILSPAQLRTLTERMGRSSLPEGRGELTSGHLTSLGYGEEMAEQILSLLGEEDLLQAYLDRAEHWGCVPVCRDQERYPALVRRRLGGDCPGCFFARGDLSLLNRPAIALVGSRELHRENREFAREAGRQAALHGLTLVSGNARGADRTAQQACLESGGTVISVVADSLTDKSPEQGVLYLSQEDFDAPFSAQRALSRNRIIHSMGYMTLVAQCDLGTGGTWSGTTKNLQQGWSLVVCFRDGSPASLELQDRGAYLLGIEDLPGLSNIRDPQMNLFTE